MNESIPAFGAVSLVITPLTILHVTKHAVIFFLQNEALATSVANDFLATLVAFITILHVESAPLAIHTIFIQKAPVKALSAPQVLVFASLRYNGHPLAAIANLHFNTIFSCYLRNLLTTIVFRINKLTYSLLIALFQTKIRLYNRNFRYLLRGRSWLNLFLVFRLHLSLHLLLTLLYLYLLTLLHHLLLFPLSLLLLPLPALSYLNSSSLSPFRLFPLRLTHLYPLNFSFSFHQKESQECQGHCQEQDGGAFEMGFGA